MALVSSLINTKVKAGFTANGYHSGDQLTPDVAALSNGGFVVAYTNSLAGGFSLLNFYDADYNPVGGAYKVPYSGGTQAPGPPSVTELANGNVLVVWDENEAGGAGLKGAIFTSNGDVVATQFNVLGLTAEPAEVQVAALSEGGFVISYTHSGNVYQARYDETNQLQDGGAFQVNAGISGDQNDSAIAALTNGRYVVTYTDTGAATPAIRARVYDADGSTLAADFVVDSIGSNAQSKVVGLQNGNWAVVYTDTGWSGDDAGNSGITLRIFTPNGQNVIADTYAHVNLAGSPAESDPDITVLENGNILVSWTRPSTGIIKDVVGRVFTQDGVALTEQFWIETQGVDSEQYASIAGLGSGKYVAAWQDGDDGDPVEGEGTDHSGTQITAEVQEIVRYTGGDNAHDTFFGDALRDVIDGGGGNDTLTGAGGDDKFIIGLGEGSDTIMDFVAGAGSHDTIDLTGFTAIPRFSNLLPLANQVGADTVINLGGGQTLTLKNVDKSALHADDFLLSGVFGDATFALNSFGSSAAGGGWSSSDQYPRTAADVNGDGRADIVGFGDTGVYVSLANANGTFQAPVMGLNSFGASAAGGGWSSGNQYPRTLGDVNGDDRADIVGFGSDGVYIALANADGTFQAPAFKLNAFGSSAAGGAWVSDDKYPRSAADVNGDGRADIVGFGDSGVYVSLANPNGTFQNAMLALNSFGYSPAGGGWSSNNQYPRMLADANDDGRADIVAFGDSGVYVALANANGTFQNAMLALDSFGYSAAGGGWTSNDKYPRAVGDVNNDGRADIVGFGDAGLYVAFGKGNGTFQDPVFDLPSFGPSAGGWSSDSQYPRMLADVNGDGSADIVGFGDTGVFVAQAQEFLV